MNERPQDNSAQREFWSDAVGHHWVKEADLMDRQHAAILDLLLDRAELAPGMQVLDIGCGAGTSTAAAARLTGPDGGATGLDISDTLLAEARRRHSGKPGVDFVNSDAQFHEFASERFDAMISRFGVMFFADTAAAFRNIASGLRPGARLTMVAWGPARNNPYFLLAAKAAQAVLGETPPTDRSLPGPFAWEDRARTMAQLEAAGLVDVAADPVEMMLTPPLDLRGFADLSTRIGAAHGVIRHHGATEAQIARVQDALVDAFADFLTPDGLRIPADLTLFTARKAA